MDPNTTPKEKKKKQEHNRWISSIKKKTNECPSNNETNLVCRERNSLPETLKAVQFLEVRAMAIQNPNCWDETNNINNNWEEAAESVGDKASLPPFFYNSPHKNRRKWTQSHWIFSERHQWWRNSKAHLFMIVKHLCVEGKKMTNSAACAKMSKSSNKSFL